MVWLRAALMLAATAVILVSVLPFGARVWWVLDLFTHFRIQYLAIALVLLLLLAAVRKFRWCVAVGICVALNASAASDYWPAIGPAPSDATQASDRIRVMTVNLSNLDFSAGPLIETIRTEAPDVVLFVEFTRFWQDRLEGLDAVYPHRLKLPARGAFGSALLSRYKLDTAKQIALGTTPAIQARVDAPGGGFTVFGVHLRAPVSRELALARNRQLEQLAELRANASGPAIVMGDFNITPFSPYFADWLARSGLRDAGAGRWPSFSWPTFLPIVGIPIDHCAVSKEFEVISYRRLPAFGSDHYPVLADLVLQ